MWGNHVDILILGMFLETFGNIEKQLLLSEANVSEQLLTFQSGTTFVAL